MRHQCIAHYFNASIKRADTPMHGKVSSINFDENSRIYMYMRQGFSITRYHSLIIDNIKLPCKYNVFGVQFHLESILSEFGKQLLF